MSTSTVDRTALLESRVEKHAKLEHLNTLVEGICQSGPEGVVRQALTNPNAILGTVAGMMLVLNVLQVENDMLLERVFELEDDLEKYQPSTS